MKIEIVEFFPVKPKEKSTVIGNLHVYLEDIGADLRGISVLMSSRGVVTIKLPYFPYYDIETKQRGHYPVFSFIDRDKFKLMEKTIKEKGREFLEEEHPELFKIIEEATA